MKSLKKAFEKIMGKEENAANHNVFYCINEKFQVFSHFSSSSAKGFNLGRSKILSFYKGLRNTGGIPGPFHV